jgi:Ni/Fe-hydrogenase subunit HybB-like protein
MSAYVHERPLGGKILTPGFLLLLALVGVWVLLVCARLLWGLNGPFGQASALALSSQNDGYAWGIWKPINVVTFTGIAAGAYAVGILTYGFNKGEFHPLIRSAVMAGAMGYTLAGTSVLIDLGRYWNLWVLFWPPIYNLNSVLLEVAICVMAYTFVLWIEVGPTVLEKLEGAASPRVAGFARRWLPPFRRVMPFVISLAILLPTMHQSSLGGLFMVAVTKTHPLWHTWWLPGLFLVSCVTMGFGAVVAIENLTNLVYGKRIDQTLLGRLTVVPAWLCVAWLAVRVGDLALAGKLGLVFTSGFYSFFFLLEMALFVAPAAMLFSPRWRANRGRLLGAAFLLLAGGALYRIDTYLVAYQPTPGWVYFPSVGEMVFTLSLGAIGVTVYVLFVKLFPILSGVREKPAPAALPEARKLAVGR